MWLVLFLRVYVRVNRCKEPERPTKGNEINKFWYIRIIEYFSIIKIMLRMK